MGKKNKKSLIWKVVKLPFIGFGKLIAFTYQASKKKIQESSEKRSLIKSPIYNLPSEFENLRVIEKISGDYSSTEKRIFEDSLILLIFGKRGSGKSSLGFRLLENIHNKTKRKCYALGIAQKLMPGWIFTIDSVEKAANGSIVLVDEGAISFGARNSMSAKNKELSKIMAVARHKNISLIFVTQNTGLIDKNILALTDSLLVKEGSLLQMEMERPEIKKFYEKANNSFKKIKGEKKSYAYLIDSDFEGVLSYKLPSFWTDSLSKNKA